jgi:hypothetical protein
VKDLLGHHSLAITVRYGHLASEHLRTAVARIDVALPVAVNLSAQGSAQEGVTEGALLSTGSRSRQCHGTDLWRCR